MGYYVKVEPWVKVYVEDINPNGNKTIVFLHGWPGNHNLFEYQFNILPKHGYRCIGIDQRGFGKSDKPFIGYDYNTLADDVRKVVEALKLKNFTLAGHSTGGAIAVRYMSRYKEYGVSKLMNFAAAAPSLIKRPNFPYGLDKKTVTSIISQTYSDRPKMLSDFGDIFFYQHITKPFADWFLSLGLQAASWSTIAVANTWIREELFNDLSSISVPTLILHGIHDKVVPFELGEIQNKCIRNSKFIPFKYSGHGLFYDEKDKFNEELMKFIEE
ncbi:alpha/beta fold hydrolase [Clostridium autoethanogenum]|uniref:Alpha/beta hydrolase n=1 Tax=Clostridium autoethanogenum DSM 10061 TaxID=1341692 RepID=A0ABM5NST4_9CLOT|nr:alpha/beta hydrolase [Clostridium autoethanogenum]AGY75310.1 alpha/beta hydrolase [Clostridium autoethanogenum DSM 10061]ALU35476.1 Chloride peroxidase [Clostridium autoethanogenum DSM 10061]OVY48565.1 Arylesterase [Clostridium autoethanogenum]